MDITVTFQGSIDEIADVIKRIQRKDEANPVIAKKTEKREKFAKCERCGNDFEVKSINAKNCPPCKKIIARVYARNYYRKHHSKKKQLKKS